ncbi:MAG: flavin reductase family protein [Candidatus Hodarchaeota archaeon]
MSYNREEIEPDEYIEYFDGNAALMVTMDKKGKCNVMALDWKKITEIEGYPVIRAQVAYSRYTYTLLTEGINEFTINIPSEKTYHAVNIAGFHSGRNVDKISESGLITIPGKNTKVPTIKNCILNYECKIIYSSKSNLSSHHYFYGKILTAYASTNIISKKNF